jgi:hypothetical protein
MYSDVSNPRQLAGKQVLWLLDSGVVHDYTKQTLDTLQSANYKLATTAELGCEFRLYRLELKDGAGTGPAEPARGMR